MSVWELIQISLLNGAIGSVGATTFLFAFYAIKQAVSS